MFTTEQIEKIAGSYSGYVKGDIQKFQSALEDAGMDIISVRTYNRNGCKFTYIEWDDGEFKDYEICRG